MFKTCIKCGKIIPANMGSRCADHPNRWRSGSTREWRKDEGTHPRPRRIPLHRSRSAWQRCERTKLLEVHLLDDGNADVLLVPDSELATVCRKHNPRGG